MRDGERFGLSETGGGFGDGVRFRGRIDAEHFSESFGSDLSSDARGTDAGHTGSVSAQRVRQLLEIGRLTFVRVGEDLKLHVIHI